MPSVEFMGKTFTVDEDGFIDSYENWCQEWVHYVKGTEGIAGTQGTIPGAEVALEPATAGSHDWPAWRGARNGGSPSAGA